MTERDYCIFHCPRDGDWIVAVRSEELEDVVLGVADVPDEQTARAVLEALRLREERKREAAVVPTPPDSVAWRRRVGPWSRLHRHAEMRQHHGLPILAGPHLERTHCGERIPALENLAGLYDRGALTWFGPGEGGDPYRAVEAIEGRPCGKCWPEEAA